MTRITARGCNAAAMERGLPLRPSTGFRRTSLGRRDFLLGLLLPGLALERGRAIESANPEADGQEAERGFHMRRARAIRAMAGKPLEKAYVSPNRWYVRPQSYAFLNFAFRCFLIGEQNDEANRAVVAFCDLYRDNLGFMREGDSYYWAGDILFGIMEKFGSCGRIVPGRLLPATERRILRMLWVYAAAESRLSDAEVERSATWDVWGSENHHIQKFYMLWHSAKFLMADPEHASRRFADGRLASEHFAAWTRYAKHWLSQRARKGLFVEFAHESYNLTTLKGIYNFHDFATDPRLRELAGKLLHLFWADWAQEQLDGVRGGAKARVYQGDESLAGSSPPNLPLRTLRYFYTGLGEAGVIKENLITLIASSYVPHPVVLRLMANGRERGSYEIVQRRLGLARDGRRGPPCYRLDQTNGGLVRYTYCTPDFILGTFHCDARPERDWTMISSQNRWMGAIFKGHPDARIVVQCDAGSQRATYNALWSVQSKGSLIAQKLPPGMSKYAGSMRIWVGDGGLQGMRETDGMVFLHYPGAHAVVRVAEGGYRWQKHSGGTCRGRWLVLKNDRSPVIIEVAGKDKLSGEEEFRRKILTCKLDRKGASLVYRSLDQDEFVFATDQRALPRVNGKTVNLHPKRCMDSPFVVSEFDSGVAMVSDGTRTLRLDLTLRPGE